MPNWINPAIRIEVPKTSKLNSLENKAKRMRVMLKIIGVAATT